MTDHGSLAPARYQSVVAGQVWKRPAWGSEGSATVRDLGSQATQPDYNGGRDEDRRDACGRHAEDAEGHRGAGRPVERRPGGSGAHSLVDHGLRSTLRVPSFDPSCLFLLNWEHTNLFEQAGNTKTIYRCKGCRQIIQTSQRKEHHRYHVVEQEEAARQARLENIAKARQARKERKAA